MHYIPVLANGETSKTRGLFLKVRLAKWIWVQFFGKVNAHIEFLHTGADGVPLAQAFALLAMDAVSSKRFKTAVEQMETPDFSDVGQRQTAIDAAFETLRESVRQFRGCSVRHDEQHRKGEPLKPA
jgi:hypothetical protein